MGIIVMLIVGALAGWIAGRIMKGKGFGVLGNIAVGIVGGVLGGWLLGWIGFAGEGLFATLVTAVIGACVLLFLLGLVKKN